MSTSTKSNIDSYQTLEGKFLIAMPGMGDSRFEKSLIYLCAHSADGAMGFVVNNPIEDPHIPEFLVQLGIVAKDKIASIPETLVKQPLFNGGPVEPGRGFVIHSGDYSSAATLLVDGATGLTATLEILREISLGKGPDNILLALGYAGWSGGQLETEIAANGWLTCDGDPAILFADNNDRKYERAMASLGIDPALLSAESGHA